jgi:plastocyanin
MRIRLLGLVLIAVGVVGVIGTSMAAGPGPGSQSQGWMTSMHEGMMGGGLPAGRAQAPVVGAPEVEVVARDFSFSPIEVTVPAGTTVNVLLVNEGDLLHDVTIPALGFSVEALPGTRASASLTVTSPGRYEFICSVPGHREAGMEGLVVAT